MPSIRTPAEHLGFEVGADRKLAGWPEVVDYFDLLGEASDRVRVEEIGDSTEGNPLILATISSPHILEDLDRYREIQSKLADPRSIEDEREAEELIGRGRVVVLITCGIHATEVGATQMSTLLGHHLATGEDDAVRRILDEVIVLLVPSLNPDGLIRVKRWYDGTVGTRHEGVSPPFLYHQYAGHDNNRDWFMFTQKETRVTVDRCLNAWHPQIAFDLHQTRPNGMRMILPPFVDPVDPNVDPTLQSQLSMLGSAIAAALTAQGKAGVAMNVVYDAYSPGRAYVHYHNGIRVLSETASVRIATPVGLQRNSLRPVGSEDPTRRTWNHPMPWTGGRWSLGDIVEYSFDAVMACLDHAARHRDMWLRGFYSVGKRAVSAGGNPYAYVVPRDQRDPVAAAELLSIMRTAEVEVHQAAGRFTAGGVEYPAGSHVLLMTQPYAAFARTLLGTHEYPDLRLHPGGPPRPPYDVTAHSLAIQMGVGAAEVPTPFQAKLLKVDSPVWPEGGINRKPGGKTEAYFVRPESNASARAVNRLLKAGAEVFRSPAAFRAGKISYAPGTYIVSYDTELEELVSSVARDESLIFDTGGGGASRRSVRLGAPRIGVYKNYIPCAEEGWTRFVLEEYGFDYTSLVDDDVRRGGLADRFDAVLLPHQTTRQIAHGHNPSHYPPDYSGGLGAAGADSLKDLVEQGGTLIAWDGATEYAIQHLDLPVRDALASVPSTEFYAPGSLLRILVDTSHPIGYGLPEECAAMFVSGPAFETGAGTVVAKYPQDSSLLSGWLVGPERLAGHAALVTVPLGSGEVVLIGFRPHFRAQARGTYRILFNALFHSASRERG